LTTIPFDECNLHSPVIKLKLKWTQPTAAFYIKILLPKNYNSQTVARETLLISLSSKKFVRRMLVKLTP